MERHQELRGRGYPGGPTYVRQYLARFRGRPGTEAGRAEGQGRDQLGRTTESVSKPVFRRRRQVSELRLCRVRWMCASAPTAVEG
jgi:hypothetical protein